jgi:O-antigen biosynthesis protein WbqP
VSKHEKVELEEGNLRMEANNSSVQRISRVSSFYAHYTKRAIDIGIATVALLILIIPFIIVAIAIKLDSKGPVIFKQQRATKNQQSFDIYKFRSMSTEAPHNMATADLDATSYITRVGAFLRKTSIDELPQLINVLHGDMSIIGP